jgi:hypothetical protein
VLWRDHLLRLYETSALVGRGNGPLRANVLSFKDVMYYRFVY